MTDVEHDDAVQDAWDTLSDEFVVSMQVRPEDRTAVERAIEARTAARYQDYVRRVYGVAAGMDMMRFFEERGEGGDMADKTRLQEAEQEAKFSREAALDVPSGAHIQRAIDTAVVAERMRLAANDGDDAFYDGGVCSVCLSPHFDGVHRDDCPVVVLRAALQQTWDENHALTRDLAASETAKLEAVADMEKVIAWLRSRDAYADAFKEWAATKRAEGYELNGAALDLHKDSRFVLDSAADHIERTWGGKRKSDG